MRSVSLAAMSILLCLPFGAALEAQTYDPTQFTVCAERSCYTVCPAGDVSFCFCISYKGAPLMAQPADVILKIECGEGNLSPGPDESLEKGSYLVSDHCWSAAGCGREYCWQFRAGGCCPDARFTFHMADDPTPFYEFHAPLHSYDVDASGTADRSDSLLIAGELGTTSPCYDITCDGVVNHDDLLWTKLLLCYGTACLGSHYGHSWFAPVATQQTTWGAIKAIYR
jgi:hypothetical protein